MKSKEFAIGVGIGLFLGLLLPFSLLGHYVITSSGDNPTFRINTRTGATWWLDGDQWKRLQEPKGDQHE